MSSTDQPDAEQILSHDAGSIVLDGLSLPELSALAQAQPRLMPSISALEQRWLDGCFKLCGGTLAWLPSDPYTRFSGGWMTVWHTIRSLRADFITNMHTLNEGRTLPDTLSWGDETWTRVNDLPQEEALNDAFAHAMLYYPSVVEGCGDPQCDTYPIGIGFYRRPAADTAPPEGAIGHLGSVTLADAEGEDNYEALEDAILKLRRAIDPEGFDDVANDVRKAVMEPVSLSSLLEETPSCMGNSPPTSSAGRRLEQAIAAAIATCAPFVALCVGEAAPLTAAHAMEVLEGTRRQIVEEELEWARDSEWKVPIADASVYDDDDDELLITLGVDRIEAALKAQVAAVAAKHGASDPDGKLAGFAAAPCGVAWDTELADCITAGPENALAKATEATYQSIRAALAAPMKAQARAVHGDAPLDDATVYPIMLTNSDDLGSYWAPATPGDNDHEGVQTLGFVSEKWVLVVSGKSASS